MGRFFFKQFSVKQDISAMKVNTDGVLLGAWCSLPAIPAGESSVKIIDVGTGTGVIALMIAQRLQSAGLLASITGIDSDIPSAEEARENFRESLWSDSLKSFPVSFKEYQMKLAEKIDLVVSNPPYFNNSLKAPCNRRSNARHTDNLSFSELIECSSKILSPGGLFSVILPKEAEMEFVSIANSNSLFLSRICRVSTINGENERRVMMEFVKGIAGSINEERLSVQESPNGSYTSRYRTLTGDFYLKF